MKIYKALYEDENKMEIFHAKNDSEAINEAFNYEEEHGTLFNVYLLDDNYNEIKCIF